MWDGRYKKIHTVHCVNGDSKQCLGIKEIQRLEVVITSGEKYYKAEMEIISTIHLKGIIFNKPWCLLPFVYVLQSIMIQSKKERCEGYTAKRNKRQNSCSYTGFSFSLSAFIMNLLNDVASLTLQNLENKIQKV